MFLFWKETNGEIVLACKGRLLATSIAAGPAFEGARIIQGMRAMAGVIEKVVIRKDVLFNVIGNAASLGAKLALLSVHEREYACQLREKTERVDISLEAEFQTEFGQAMIFPGQDIDACPD